MLKRDIYIAVDGDRTAINDLKGLHTKELLNTMFLNFVRYQRQNVKGIFLCTHRCLQTMGDHYNNFKNLVEKNKASDTYDVKDFLTYKVAENLAAELGIPVVVSTLDDKKN